MKKENINKMRLLDSRNELWPSLPDRDCSLKIFNEYVDIEAKPTDLCLLTGGVKDKQGYTPYFADLATKNRQSVITSTEYSPTRHYDCDKTAISPGIRPAMEVKEVPQARAMYYGEYPQLIETDQNICSELLKLRDSNVTTTGKTYCFDGEHEISEYEYKGNKYVPVISATDGEELSDGTKTKRGKLYWVKVSPVMWYVDETTKLLVSVYALLSGIPYWTDNLDETDCKKSNMYSFINKFLMRDITNCKDLEKEFDDRLIRKLRLTDTDILKTKVSRLFKKFKEHYSTGGYPAGDHKEHLTLYARQNTIIFSLPDGELKDTLYKLLVNNLTALYEVASSSRDNEKLYKAMKETMRLLKEAISKKTNTVDLSVLTNFIDAVALRLERLVYNNEHYLIDGIWSRWYMIQEYLNEIFNIITLNDNNDISNRLKKFVAYDNKYNELLIRLDVDLGEYTPYDVQRAVHNPK